MKQPLTVVIRCDASPEIGFGHLFRCLAVADELRDNHGIRVVFAMTFDNASSRIMENRGYEIVHSPGISSSTVHDGWLQSAVRSAHASALILDVRDNLSVSTLAEIKAANVLLATLDDPSDRRLMTDLAFYPPVPQVAAMNWSSYRGDLRVGWEWVIVRPEVLLFRGKHYELDSPSESILVTMGGSDPAGMTVRALSEIDTLKQPFDTVVVLGPGYSDMENLTRFQTGARRQYRIEKNPADLPRLMAESSIAVISFGVTAYELATIGIPMIMVSLTADHAASAGCLEMEGAGIHLGIFAELPGGSVASSTSALLANREARLVLRKSCLDLIDGRGAKRIAQLIALRMEQAA